MQLQDAITLIEKAGISNESPQSWADLGSGRGLFSRSLLSILPAGSIVHAVDIEQQDLHDYPSSVIFHRADFSADALSLPPLDGILMANALHYVSEQVACIRRLAAYLRSGEGKFILVEYDTSRPNAWVPYPISFSRAQEIFEAAGFSQIEKIGERRSLYRSDQIYAAVVTI